MTGANVGGPFVVLKICGQSSLGQMTLRSIVMQPAGRRDGQTNKSRQSASGLKEREGAVHNMFGSGSL